MKRQKVIFDNDQDTLQVKSQHAFTEDTQQVLRPENSSAVKDIPDTHRQSARIDVQQRDKINTDTLVQEGIKEINKEQVKTTEQARRTIEELAAKQDSQLLCAKSVFPIDFFPDTIMIDSLTVSVIEKNFFASEHVTTISFKDIIEVWVETSWLLANLTIRYVPKVEGGMSRSEPIDHKIKLLKRADAIKARNILKGIIFVRREGVDTTKINVKELLTLIENFGERGAQI